MRHQQRLTGPRPLQLAAVVSDAALRRCAGHPAVANGQLKHLVTQANLLSTCACCLLRLSAPGRDGMVSLSFPGGMLTDAAYQEYAVGSHLIDDQVIVTQLGKLFAALGGQALGADASLATISELPTMKPDRQRRGMMNDLTHAPWRKSSRSGGGGECIEVADLADGGRVIRDSKDPAGPKLRFTPAAWAAFTTEVRDGEFNCPDHAPGSRRSRPGFRRHPDC